MLHLLQKPLVLHPFTYMLIDAGHHTWCGHTINRRLCMVPNRRPSSNSTNRSLSLSLSLPPFCLPVFSFLEEASQKQNKIQRQQPLSNPMMEETLPQQLTDASARTQGEIPELQVLPLVSTTSLKDLTSGKRGRGIRRRRTTLRSVTGRAGGGAGQDNDDEDQDDHDAGNGSTMDQQRHQWLACPFYKLNTMRHMSCSRLRLSRIRDVKQHLLRRHRQPPYCPVCSRIFDGPQDRDGHIMARTCHAPPGGVLLNVEGVTETQRTALGRRVNRALDEAGQWFSVWQILFPNVPHPLSPYLSTQFVEVLGILHESWGRERDMLIADVVQAAANDRGSDHRRVVTELSCQIIDNFFTRFHTTCRALMNPASPDSTTLDVSILRSLTGLPPLAPTFPPGQRGRANIQDGGQTSSNSAILTPNFTTPSFHPFRPAPSPTSDVSAALSSSPYSHTFGSSSGPAFSEMQSVEPLDASSSVEGGSSLIDDLDLSSDVHGSLSPYRAALSGSGSGLFGPWAGAHQDTNAVETFAWSISPRGAW